MKKGRMEKVAITTYHGHLVSSMTTYEMDCMPNTHIPCDEYEACKQLEERGFYRFHEMHDENKHVQLWQKRGKSC